MTIHKTNPIKSDVIIAALKNPNFLDIVDGTTHYYGGDQAWYTDSFERNGGCGVVAAANILAYLSTTDIKYNNLYTYNTFDKTDYTSHMNDMLQYIHIRNLFGNPIGVWSMNRFTSGLHDFAISKGYNTLKIVGYSVFNVDMASDLIKNALTNNKPVAILIGFNSNLNHIHYQYPNGTGNYASFERHWVTVTEIKIDKITKTNVMKVSSWGASAHINTEDFVNGEWVYRCMVYFE